MPCWDGDGNGLLGLFPRVGARSWSSSALGRALPCCAGSPQGLHRDYFPQQTPLRATWRTRRSSSQQPTSNMRDLSHQGRGWLGPAIAPGAPWGQHASLPPVFRKGSPSLNAAHPSRIWKAITHPVLAWAASSTNSISRKESAAWDWESCLPPAAPRAPTRSRGPHFLHPAVLACSSANVINAHKNIRN